MKQAQGINIQSAQSELSVRRTTITWTVDSSGLPPGWKDTFSTIYKLLINITPVRSSLRFTWNVRLQQDRRNPSIMKKERSEKLTSPLARLEDLEHLILRDGPHLRQGHLPLARLLLALLLDGVAQHLRKPGRNSINH